MASVPRHVAAPRPFLIGVAGGTARARPPSASDWRSWPATSTLALIKLDSYYVSHDDQPLDERAKFNYDHPDAFDWQLLNDHLAALAAGATVPVPIYDYTNHDRSDEVRMVAPARIVVVEGILVLVGADAARALRPEGVHRHRRRPAVHPPPAARRRRARPHARQHHRPVPRNRCARATSSSSSPASATPT